MHWTPEWPDKSPANDEREDIPCAIDAELTRRQLLRLRRRRCPPLLGHGAAFAQTEWPSRPVRVIVPYPPAGGADTVSRILFQKLGELWGAQFVIDNRGGAGGTIGAAAAAKAERDGYTVLYDATAHSVNPFLYPKLPYDTVKDFQAVFLASLVPNILVVNNVGRRRRPSTT